MHTRFKKILQYSTRVLSMLATFMLSLSSQSRNVQAKAEPFISFYNVEKKFFSIVDDTNSLQAIDKAVSELISNNHFNMHSTDIQSTEVWLKTLYSEIQQRHDDKADTYATLNLYGKLGTSLHDSNITAFADEISRVASAAKSNNSSTDVIATVYGIIGGISLLLVVAKLFEKCRDKKPSGEGIPNNISEPFVELNSPVKLYPIVPDLPQIEGQRSVVGDELHIEIDKHSAARIGEKTPSPANEILPPRIGEASPENIDDDLSPNSQSPVSQSSKLSDIVSPGNERLSAQHYPGVLFPSIKSVDKPKEEAVLEVASPGMII